MSNFKNTAIINNEQRIIREKKYEKQFAIYEIIALAGTGYQSFEEAFDDDRFWDIRQEYNNEIMQGLIDQMDLMEEIGLEEEFDEEAKTALAIMELNKASPRPVF